MDRIGKRRGLRHARVAHPPATAQTIPNYDFDWATVTHPGNAPYDGGQYGLTAGIGRVDYVYRISKLEITTDQWLEYVNIFSPGEEKVSGTIILGQSPA